MEEELAWRLVEAFVAGEDLDPGDPGDATARRAEELVSEHLDRPMSLAEVARELGVSPRTVSRIFRNRHGTSPIAFLRRRRLEAARCDLVDAEPGQESVTQVALRYGFQHLGRFAIDYRRSFGESPSETLSQ